MSTTAPATIAWALVSHTNAGKTTLARTLLGRDVGEVRDAPHVTAESTRYTMIASPDGDELQLWDTPGFGDSTRLARRLAQQGNPIGWFLAQVWDRFRDRPLWLAQQAVRTVRDAADVVLYLVNASERPEDAGYIAPEFDVLRWIGKPVIVLLNQTGEPRPPEEEAGEEQAWRAALAPHALVAALLTLDAFARCWVQEITLFRAVNAALPEAKRLSGERLAGAWEERRQREFDAAMQALAEAIAHAACDSATDTESALPTLRSLGRALGIGRSGEKDTPTAAMQALAANVQTDVRASTDALLAIHGLEGRAAAEILERVASQVSTSAPVDERKAAVLGGVVSGVLTGLAADLAAGGLTLGAGMIAGGLLGALGAAGIARGYNVVRGTTGTIVRWSDAFLDRLVAGALLRYLAVAHFGRGRGQWRESESPAFWREVVDTAVDAHRPNLAALWSERTNVDAQALAPRVAAVLRELALDVLARLYPGTIDRSPRSGERGPARPS